MATHSTTGYSGKSLAQKLGIKPGMQLIVLAAPAGYEALLGDLPASATIVTALARPAAAIHAFVRSRDELEAGLAEWQAALAGDGMLWISWPKRTSPLAGDLNENAVRESGLRHGLVDVKVAAVDRDWSALKFVRRLADRRAG